MVEEYERRGMLSGATAMRASLSLVEVRLGSVMAAGIAAHTVLDRVASVGRV